MSSRWPDRLFLLFLAVSLVCYGLNRFLRVRFFAWPAVVLLTPRSILGGAIQSSADLRRDNERLTELCARQAIDNARWRDATEAAARETTAARYGLHQASVIGRDPQNLNSTLIVDKGLLQGIRSNMAAITELGVAGKVIEAGPNLSFVATLLNPRVRVAALDLRSRVAGVIGWRDGNELVLNYVPLGADVTIGDSIVTSGTGGVFPKGLSIGIVVRTDSTPAGMFRSIAVRPSVAIDALERMSLVEAADWAEIELRRQEARLALEARQQKDLLRLLNTTEFEKQDGVP